MDQSRKECSALGLLCFLLEARKNITYVEFEELIKKQIGIDKENTLPEPRMNV